MILQSGLNSQGKLILRATIDGQTSGEISIDVTPAVARPAATALANPPLVILNWKRSPVTAERPDPNQQRLNTDMNTWTNAHPGSWLPPFRDGRFAIYRAEFTPRSGVQKSGGPLILHDVFGKAQVWIDGKLAVRSRTPEKETSRSRAQQAMAKKPSACLSKPQRRIRQQASADS